MPLLLLVAALVHAACPAPLTAKELDQRLEAAESAWALLDGAGFRDQSDAAALDLPCLAEAVPSRLAARYHRVVGLRSFSDGDNALAGKAFAAARAADPGYSFPDGLVPPGHAIRELYGEPLGSPPDRPIPWPAEGRVTADGLDAQRYIPERPTLVQRLAAGGAPILSRYRLPGDPWPEYPFVVGPVEDVSGPVPAPEPSRRRRNVWPARITFGVVGVGAAVAAGVLYGQAAKGAAAFEAGGDDWTLKDLDDHRTRTNTFVWVSAGTALVGAASLTVAVAIR